MNRRGFTLVELIIVMLILGIGAMTVTPIMVEKAVGVPEEVKFFNEILAELEKEAVELGRPVQLRGFQGSANVVMPDGERRSIPGVDTVSNITINDVEPASNEYIIHIYPKHICDHFIIEFGEERSLESLPLLLKTRIVK
ncbi:type II secretion system protein [Limisalsivibrio acetivorans]|uniref:type II secretion system protein n=1 Tax=Limisalsivibrio acetivorans TaxID=1304888 RepID=UPI0003B6EF59|nr:type II secretion system protein [Limisalsivibrio acetivorans]